MARIAREVGFTAILQGIRVANPRRLDAPATQQQISNAISVSRWVEAYFLGELTARQVDFPALKTELARIRWNTGKPVTTSFLHDDYVGKRGDRLRELEDFTVRGLLRPWQGESGDPGQAVEAVRQALETFRHDDKPSLLTFVFYPSGGGAGFTTQNQYAFFEGVLSLRLPLNVNIVYFSSFDIPYKTKTSETTDNTPAYQGRTGLFAVELTDDEKGVKFIEKKALKAIRQHIDSSQIDVSSGMFPEPGRTDGGEPKSGRFEAARFAPSRRP